MDSFFSLFDPSEGGQSKNKRNKDQEAKKKCDQTSKGRRRGRKSSVKNETLPEESSFLCEPQLSTDVLVKDMSYIDNYIEMNTDKFDGDKRPKRKNSGRKTRRKKKISPCKEVAQDNTSWNNQSAVVKVCDENIGKNVNDLKSDCKNNNKTAKHGDREVYNVIDKLEKVILKDNMYLSGDFESYDWENECYYSSDEEYNDDDTSDLDDSGDEVYGNLPPEPRFGNVEYKLQLVSLCEKRFQHLVTQLKWRLRSGGGSATYVLGVRDCGALVGLPPAALRASLRALARMCAALGAAPALVTARRLAPRRAVAEVCVTQMPDAKHSELRVAVMGANEAGKSTLIGVLTQGELDNGRGSARLNMFRHLHEVKSGRTSSLSHEILGFDSDGNVVNYGCSELMTAERIGERSAKLVSFLDLAGHSKYQRTTLHGLTGYSPHYAMLCISATAGITPITEEHLSVLTALELPMFCVISKCELAPNVSHHTRALADLLNNTNKRPLLITDENMARNCALNDKCLLDMLNEEDSKNNEGCEILPVFPVSCVKGLGLSVLHAYLLALTPAAAHRTDDESCEFQIDEIFHVGDNTGPVVGGLLAKGQLFEGESVIIGPMEDGSFTKTKVKSIYRNRVPCGVVRAGQCASVCVGERARPGMVLLSVPGGRGARGGSRPVFGGCAPGGCKNTKTQTTIDQIPEKLKNKKTVRRKDNNLLQIEDKFNKQTDTHNLYDDGCVCDDKVLLEDPNDPRGCLYFQASVQVLRHSTTIYPGFQCTVHVGNVRQTAIIEGILSVNNVLVAGTDAAVLFRFVRCPEYLVKGRRLLFTAGLGTRGIGRITQVFPYVP